MSSPRTNQPNVTNTWTPPWRHHATTWRLQATTWLHHAITWRHHAITWRHHEDYRCTEKKTAISCRMMITIGATTTALQPLLQPFPTAPGTTIWRWAWLQKLKKYFNICLAFVIIMQDCNSNPVKFKVIASFDAQSRSVRVLWRTIRRRLGGVKPCLVRRKTLLTKMWESSKTTLSQLNRTTLPSSSVNHFI